jgi:glucose uptake protein
MPKSSIRFDDNSTRRPIRRSEPGSSMFVVNSYPLAVAFCIITMLCWGSWANTQKLASARWRFELFYCDYVAGVFILALILALTLGSHGETGRSFVVDLKQADAKNIASAMLGGAIFNVANVLLVAAIAIAGMAVAFPVGIGLALVLGVLVNYLANPGSAAANPTLLFIGVSLVTAAIVLDAIAYRRLPNQAQGGAKGLILSILCGITMGFFYRFVAASMATDAQYMEAGKVSPYTAMVCFSLGLLLSNVIINPLIMIRPFTGEPISMSSYFRGSIADHMWGVVGGMVWGVGMTFSIVAAGKAGFAISYGLGQGATLVAAIWGVFIWQEFRDAPKGVNSLLALMFAGYVLGLSAIILAR